MFQKFLNQRIGIDNIGHGANFHRKGACRALRCRPHRRAMEATFMLFPISLLLRRLCRIVFFFNMLRYPDASFLILLIPLFSYFLGHFLSSYLSMPGHIFFPGYLLY